MLTRRTFLGGIGAAALATATWGKEKGVPSKVQVGVCSRDVAGAVKYGYDYIEPGAADIAAMSEEQFQKYADEVLSSPIRCEAFNSFIRRPDLKVLAKDFPTPPLTAHIDPCLAPCRNLAPSI